jgi:hypothetical protein
MTTLLWDLAAFIFLVFGTALLIAPLWKKLSPVEALTAGIGCSLFLIFLAGFTVHITRLPRALWWLLPVLLIASLLLRRQGLKPFLEDSELRKLGYAWMVFSVWTIGLLGFVLVYSGGSWCSDWLEHYERALFFLQGGEASQHFYKNLYSLSARPPLANVVTAVLMHLSGGTFADFQVLNALLGTLIIFPAWLLCRRWARPGTTAPLMLCAMLMLNPLVMQNLTFAWTKLITAFWILSGVYFLLAGLRDPDARHFRAAGFSALSAAMLTHYSAGPWIIVAVGVYFLTAPYRPNQRAFWNETLLHAGLAMLVFSPWLAWCVGQLGLMETLTQNTSFQGAVHRPWSQQLITAWLNFYDTLVPHAFRSVNTAVLDQPSKLGWLRDYFFNFYQLILLPALGVGGLLILAPLALTFSEAVRKHLRESLGWLAAIILIVFLGTAVHTARDDWGLTHICLQPLVIIGLAWLGSRLPGSSSAIRVLWLLGVCMDFVLGIVLHYSAQALWIAPLEHLNLYARLFNGPDLQSNGLVTFGAHLAPALPIIGPCLLLLLTTTVFLGLKPTPQSA